MLGLKACATHPARAHILNAGKKRSKLGMTSGFETAKSGPSDALPPAKSHRRDLYQQFMQLRNRRSSARSYGGQSQPVHHTPQPVTEDRGAVAATLPLEQLQCLCPSLHYPGSWADVHAYQTYPHSLGVACWGRLLPSSLMP